MALPIPPEIQEQLDHEESQRILKEETLRYGEQDLSLFFENAEDETGLEGEPLSLKDVKKLCPNHFVRDTLFRITGRARETAPVKLSDLQHKGLARTLLLRFIQRERSLPNNNQMALYFIQQCYVRDIMKRRVNFNDRPFNAGVGQGRIADRAAARRDGELPPPRKKPVVLLPNEHEHLHVLATQGAAMATQGDTYESLKERVSELLRENVELKKKLEQYQILYGELPQADAAEGSDILINIDDILNEYRPSTSTNIP